ncbi:MAG: hypothetical protein WC943_13530, partial [Elusimicrobiota bacterium]
NVYELTLIDRKDIKNGSLHHYTSKLSPYVLTRPEATGVWSRKYSPWKVTTPSDGKFSTDMVMPGPAFVPPNLQYLVMAPTEVLPTGTQMKIGKEREAAEKARLAKDAAAAKAEKERLAKERALEKEKAAREEAARKEAQQRLAKEAAAREAAVREAAAKAEQERLAKEAAERQARESAGKQPPAPVPGKAPEAPKDQPAASNDLTPFEIIVLKAGETDPEKAKIDAALKNKGTKEYAVFLGAAKTKVMGKVQAYVHSSWQPKNPG